MESQTEQPRHGGSKWLFLAAVTVAGLAIDILTKYYAERFLHAGVPFKIVGDQLSFFLIHNKAALWGLDPRLLIPGFPLNWFFCVFNILAITVLLAYYANVKMHDRFIQWGLALILPGALGNLSDRVLHADKGVVDFIKMGISANVSWPIYNCADMYVTFGVAFIVLSMLLEEKKKKGNNAP